ncbi:MAG: TVP38/TMEM64 family protein [Peptostreptococcaceae bacterium]
MSKNNKKIVLGIIFLIIVVILIYKICTLNLGVDEIKAYVESFGNVGPLVYIIMFALVPLTLFPDSILAIAGGLIFGLGKGYIYTTIGALIGGSISFYISRYWGRDIVKKITKEKLDKIEHMVNNQGFTIIFLLRLIPLFPFDVISYGAGLTCVKYKDFILATLIGTIPGILVFTNLGAQVVNIGSNNFYISIALLILLFIVSIALKNKFISKELKNDTN